MRHHLTIRVILFFSLIGLLILPCAAQAAQTQRQYPRLIFVRQAALWLRESSGAERQLTRDYQDANPAVSPDGKLVVFEREKSTGTESELWLLKIKNGESRRLLSITGTCTMPCFDPSGAQLYFVHSRKPANKEPWLWLTTIATIDLTSGKWHDLAPLIKETNISEETLYAFPMISPDGKWLIWSPVPHEGDDCHIYKTRRDGTGRATISDPKRPAKDVSYGYYFASPVGKANKLVCLHSKLVGPDDTFSIAVINYHDKELWHRQVDSIDRYGRPVASDQGLIAFANSYDDARPTISVIDSKRRAKPIVKLISNASQPAWVPTKK